jgi:hypothetical protein
VATIRRLKDIALHLKNSFKTIIIVSPVVEIPPELEKAEATKMKATSITLLSSHVAMLSHPREVGELIEHAAIKAGNR